MDLHLSNKGLLLVDFTGKTPPSLLEEIAKKILVEGGNLLFASAKENRARDIASKLQGKIGFLDANPATSKGQAEIFAALPACDVFIDATLPLIGVPLQEDSWEEDFAASVRSAQLLSFPYLRQMKEKDWGRIITLTLHSNAMKDDSEAAIRSIQQARSAFSASLTKTLKGTSVTANLCQLHLTGYPAPHADQHVASIISFLSSPASDGLNGGILPVQI